ncbi:hypothetical protein ACH4TC_35075 [Streptomyces spororaveus]|uniref:hypothetical protein n=1 Tax=Streptomyces TaxID=1883 RepID=UPI0037A07CD2
MTGLDAERLVSLSADERGSGYLLTPDLVLTAGHCVGMRDSTATVRKYVRRGGGYDLSDEPHTFTVVAKGTQDTDFALLTSTTADPFGTGSLDRYVEVRLGRLVGEEAVPAQTLGFPRSQLYEAGTEQFLNVEDARGAILPRTGARHLVQQVNFQIQSGSPRAGRGASWWSGMSGAALFSGDHLVGVITDDRAKVDGRLHALPVSRIFGDDGSEEAKACLLAAMSLPADATVLLDPVWAGGEVLQPAYSPLPLRDLRSEAALLEARYEVVPFTGRAQELSALVDWCQQADGRRMRLITGGGTVGKTRLARELCRRMARKHWVTGFVDPLCADFSNVCDLAEKRLLVIDDADARAGQLEALLTTAAEHPARHSLRILAVAHNGGLWWDAFRRRFESLADVEDVLSIEPLPEAGREDVYLAALAAFSKLYEQNQGTGTGRQDRAVPDGAVLGAEGEPRPGAGIPALGEADFGSFLLILIQALVDARAGLDKAPSALAGPPSRSRSDALLDYAIDVERQRWVVSAEGQKLPSDPVLLERIVAVSSLAVAGGQSDGEKETEAARRLLLVPDLAGEPEWLRRAFARWQHTAFVGDGYMRSLQPQRLAERLGAKVIATFPDLASKLLDVAGGGPGVPQHEIDQARQILNVLHVLQLTAGSGESPSGDMVAPVDAMAGPTAQQTARERLEEALRAHAVPLVRLVNQLALTKEIQFASAMGTSLAAALNSTLGEDSAQEVAAQVLPEFDESPPDVVLKLATAIAQHAVQYHQRDGTPATQENRRSLARAQQRWSLYLASSGMRNRAREVAGQAVDTYHALQQLMPSEEHDLCLAEAMRNLADRLFDIGRFEDADSCAGEAIRRLETLFQSNATRRHAFALVTALCTRATAAHHIGRQREAMQAATAACELIEALPAASDGEEDKPDDVLGMKAGVLRCRAWQLGAKGDVDQALEKAAESVRIYEDLRSRTPGRWKRDIAEALNVLGTQHAAKQQWGECIDRHRRAVEDYYNPLEREYREAVRPQHALALRRLAYGYLGRARSQPPPESRLEDLHRALQNVELALQQYERMCKEDRWAKRIHEASARCLTAEILLDLSDTDRHPRAAAASRQNLERAGEAARQSLDLYDEIDPRAWKLRLDRAHAQAVLATSFACQGFPRAEVLAAYKEARQAFARLDAEEPGRVEEELRHIEDVIKEFAQGAPPHVHQPRPRVVASRPVRRRKRQQTVSHLRHLRDARR